MQEECALVTRQHANIKGCFLGPSMALTHQKTTSWWRVLAWEPVPKGPGMLLQAAPTPFQPCDCISGFSGLVSKSQQFPFFLLIKWHRATISQFLPCHLKLQKKMDYKSSNPCVKVSSFFVLIVHNHNIEHIIFLSYACLSFVLF